ncbi:HAD family hydrolase [Pseudoramibacter porci]|uniref:HAD family phosphatase n=1 Tax=Pseudoramibacter porci TaxID=2606631 RepID=A0A7X2NEK5_9FIRM|nr:HAD family phosphatase [Pseudoramibacter porci]MSS18950.1 HAD family phosphatase [Pseudoramibacter porci]
MKKKINLNGLTGAVLDVDGTLLDTMPIWHDVGARVLSTLGITPEPGLGELLFDMTLDQSSAYLKEHYRLSLSIDAIQQAILNEIAAFYRKEAPLKPGALNFVQTLAAQMPLAVASVGDRALIRAAFSRLNILDCFAAILTDQDPAIRAGKSSPKIFLAAAEAIHSKPSSTLVVEDNLTALTTAHTAGFPTLAVYDPANQSDWPQIVCITDAAVRSLEGVCLNQI